MNFKKHQYKQLAYCEHCDYPCHSVCPVFLLSNQMQYSPKKKSLDAKNSLDTWSFDSSLAYACISCDACKQVCPHRNDVAEALSYIKEKKIANEVMPKAVADFEVFFYKKLQQKKAIPYFFTFYHLGYRDEAITELRLYFRALKKKKVRVLYVGDYSFIHLVTLLKKELRDLSLPKLIYSMDIFEGECVEEALFLAPTFFQNRSYLKRFAKKVYLAEDLLGVSSVMGYGLEYTNLELYQDFFRDLKLRIKEKGIQTIFIMGKIYKVNFEGHVIQLCQDAPIEEK